ncbi:AraC family transcriptional regulator [Streptomyces olivaceoviridis]|uniref:AraC family transcriptional regulator n=1 Tax=Streptomyces olivaceoviridis TaxID=1921 RepID=UPI00370120AB
MDTLAGLLDGPRARGAFLLRSVLDPPWSMRIQDGAPLSLVTLIRGTAWIGSAELRPGDVALVRGPEPYTVADTPGTPVEVVVNPGQQCSSVDGTELGELRDLGVRTWGSRLGGHTEMITGTYQMHSEVGRRLLDALPPVLIRPADTALVSLLSAEMAGTGLAQELVLDRILDLFLLSVLRAWLDDPGAETPNWHHAQSDPVVGAALRMLHDDPGHPWTVAALAAGAGVSRAVLARRFTELVGEPPMTYLTGWRLTLAADLLRDPDTTVGAVAQRVGYGSAFALSAAFKRERGLSPQEHRARVPLLPRGHAAVGQPFRWDAAQPPMATAAEG